MQYYPITAGVRGQESSEEGNGFRDSTMLTYWGSVIVEASTTGFAMEFIGDMNDSQRYKLNRYVVSIRFQGADTRHFMAFRCQPSVVEVL